MRSFSIVVAMDLERGIGKGGSIPWHLAGDLRYFKEITTKTDSPEKQNAVIMGRKTWESISEKYRPLVGRVNCVVSRQGNLALPQGVLRMNSLEEALQRLGESPWSTQIESIFIIGGGQIYGQAIQNPACQRLYITQVHSRFACDTFFPEFKGEFREVFGSPQKAEKSLIYQFFTYQR